MSAILCGKRSFFEDTPSPVSKRIRCSSTSPVRYSPPRSSVNSQRASAVEHLVVAFPGMDKQLIEKVLDDCGDDLDSAIRRLNELCLGSAEVSNAGKLNGEADPNPQQETQAAVAINTGANGESGLSQGRSVQNNPSMDGAQWVELFVSEMMCASNMDDARARASMALEALEKSIVARAGAEAAQSFQQENAILKEQIQALVQENTILKRAVAIQHERQKDYEDKTQEMQHLKQMISHYEDKTQEMQHLQHLPAIQPSHLKQMRGL